MAKLQVGEFAFNERRLKPPGLYVRVGDECAQIFKVRANAKNNGVG